MEGANGKGRRASNPAAGEREVFDPFAVDTTGSRVKQAEHEVDVLARLWLKRGLNLLARAGAGRTFFQLHACFYFHVSPSRLWSSVVSLCISASTSGETPCWLETRLRTLLPWHKSYPTLL